MAETMTSGQSFDFDMIRKKAEAVFASMSETDRLWHLKACDNYDFQKRQGVENGLLAQMCVPQDYRDKKGLLRVTAGNEGFYRRVLFLWEQIQNGSPKNIILLAGKSGIGKTHLACHCLYTLVKGCPLYEPPKKIGKYLSAYKLAMAYKKADAKNAKTDRDAILREAESIGLREADYFVLDEVGLEKSLAGYERQFLYDFFDKRRDGVIVCTNMGGPSLREFLGEVVYDRIHARVAQVKTDTLQSWRTEVDYGAAYDLDDLAGLGERKDGMSR